MASRHIKVSCPECATIWRMARSNIQRARYRGGPFCPVCRAVAVVGDCGVTPEQSAQHKALCEKVAAEAAAPLNAETSKRTEAMLARRKSWARGNRD